MSSVSGVSSVSRVSSVSSVSKWVGSWIQSINDLK
jgi:hypothetical protein